MEYKLTQQEAFDLIVERAKDKRQALGEDSRCRYRTEDPSKPKACFIGALIPDEHYDPRIEGKNVEALKRYCSEAAKYIPFKTSPAFRLQGIHDDSSPSEWESELKSFALDHDLEYKETI